jgi:hypothetical protein
MSAETGRSPSAQPRERRKNVRSLLQVGVLALLAGAVAAVVVIACDDTGPSPIGMHFDDSGSTDMDSATAGDGEAGDEGGDGGTEASDEAGDDSGGMDGGSDAADAADG